ncbi:MAG: 16S rRNA (guanine(527)-N(7))-methyltransferase RsmG [Chloroflexota bacterium]
MPSLLVSEARAFGIELTADQGDQFRRYSAELLAWNERINLTGITDPAEVDSRHFLDSLACLLAPFPHAARVLDVGSGAGLPGLPLKIARPDLRLTLLEATAKKARFVEHTVGMLGLADVEVLAERAETLGRRERFDRVVARAVAALPALLELTLPFCALGGLVLAMKKGSRVPGEVTASTRALKLLGGEIEPPLAYRLGGEERQLLVIRKANATPAMYPRRPGQPAKHPL